MDVPSGLKPLTAVGFVRQRLIYEHGARTDSQRQSIYFSWYEQNVSWTKRGRAAGYFSASG